MQCAKPIWIQRKDGLRKEVACGSCVSCKIQKAREWATRCLHEATSHQYSCFLTLTYDDHCLPKNGSLDLIQLQKFWKRLRKETGERKIRYYACGEYGEKKGRPHYHAMLFGMEPCSCPKFDPKNPKYQDLVEAYCRCKDRQIIKKVWPYGFVERLGTVTYDSARYCADYIGKVTPADDAIAYGLRERPFHVISQGLGRNYADQNAEKLRTQQGVTVRGVQVGLPRYYMNRLEIKSTKEKKEEMLEKQAPSSRPRTWIGQLREDLWKLREPRQQKDRERDAGRKITRKGSQ